MQQARGSQFDMTPFSTPGIGIIPQASHMVGISFESGSPSGTGPPVTMPQQTAQNFDELVSAASGSFQEDDVLAASEGIASGNRWLRQETLALLKIRSDMDVTFRDASLKAPLWDEVARKLAELGYKRSAKKCKEKFENVHKYYKRTKEGRAGRQDGKSYRFFTELEALHCSGAAASIATAAAPVSTVSPTAINNSTMKMVLPSSSAPSQTRPLAELNPIGLGDYPLDSVGLQAVAAAAVGISFSSNSSSSGSDDEDTEEACGRESGDCRKRKREGLSGSNKSEKMAAFFDRLMKQVMERQESMQKKFLEMIEKREQDRMIREEAWRRQEMARLSREQELLAQERAMAASRDAALLSYLQNLMKTFTNLKDMPLPPTPIPQILQHKAQPPAIIKPVQQQPLSPQPEIQQREIQQSNTENLRQQQCTELVAVTEQQEKVGRLSFEPASSSRWPKAEIHDLINLRSSLESRYQEAGPKGPLWEDISAGMQRLGYNRSAKRCKEKWENINKYFKKVKESSKKRPEDAKTCPYFHQLDALYRRKQHDAGIVIRQQLEIETNSNPNVQSQTPAQQPQIESDGKNHNENRNKSGGNSESGEVQVQTSNGRASSSFIEGGKKPEDTIKELMGQRQQETGVMDDYNKMDEVDRDDMDQDFSDDDNEDEEGGKMQYQIQYQRPNVSDSGGYNTSRAAATANAGSGSFLTVVQ